MTFFFTNNIRYIFIVRRLGKQSKLILSRSDSISNLELNLKIHGPCGPDAHAGADLQAFLIFCSKPNLLSAHKLILLIYGDNTVMDFTLPRMLSLCAIKAGCGLWCLNEAACTCNWMIQLEKIKGKTYSSKTKRNHRCAGTTTTEQAFDPSHLSQSQLDSGLKPSLVPGPVARGLQGHLIPVGDSN